MALTSTTVFDLVGQTQSITFNNPSQVDQISFASNQVTFSASTGYDLSKSDLLLYNKYLQAFNVLLLVNFNTLGSQALLPWPLCNFDITESSSGVTHLTFNENTGSTNVIYINYVPTAVAASFATRSAPVTITMQEYFMFVLMMQQYAQQVSQN
jgi:hypothetical protein